MSLFTLCIELLLALAKVIGLSVSATKTNEERAAGAALQRAEDSSREIARIEKAADADVALGTSKLPDPFDRDCPN